MVEPQVRAFVAVALPPEVKAVLGRVLEHFIQAIGQRGVKWVNAEACHITLKFLGNVPAFRIPELGEALKRAALRAGPFTLSFDSIGAFPSQERPRVVWVGQTLESQPLMLLQQEVEKELAAAAFPPEARRFTSHITLGRVRDHAPPDALAGLPATMLRGRKLIAPAPTAAIDEVVLFQSTLTRAGAIYSPLATATLQGVREGQSS